MRNIGILDEMVKEYGVRDLFESLTDNALKEDTKNIFKNQLRRLCIILGLNVDEDRYDYVVDSISKVFNEFSPIYKVLFSNEHLNMISTPDGKSKHTEYVTKNILLYGVKMLDKSEGMWFKQQEYGFIKLHCGLRDLSDSSYVDIVNKAFLEACKVYKEYDLESDINKNNYKENFKYDMYYKFIKNRAKYAFMQSLVNAEEVADKISLVDFMRNKYSNAEDVAEVIGDIIARRDILVYTNDTPGKYANLNCVILDNTNRDREYLDRVLGMAAFESLEEEYRCCITV